MAAFRAPVCFINFGLIPYRHRYCTYLYYLRGRIQRWFGPWARHHDIPRWSKLRAFKDGTAHGQGTMTYPDGASCVHRAPSGYVMVPCPWAVPSLNASTYLPAARTGVSPPPQPLCVSPLSLPRRCIRPQRVCHFLRVERARQRLRLPLQHPHHPCPGLPPHRRIRPQRVCHSLRRERARQRLSPLL